MNKIKIDKQLTESIKFIKELAMILQKNNYGKRTK